MRAFRSAALCAAVFVSACKIERTPPQYVDHRQPLGDVRAAVAEELQDRLLALGQALARGDASEAALALAPASDAEILLPGDSAVLTGGEAVAAAVDRFAAGGIPQARMDDVRVTVGPRANVAWFRAVLHLPQAETREVRVSGVFLRLDEGEWRLVQAHLSEPTPPPSPQPPSPDAAADSLAGG